MTVYKSPQDGTDINQVCIDSVSPTSTLTVFLCGETNIDTHIFRDILSLPDMLSSIPSHAKTISASLFMKIKADYSSNARTLKVFRLKRNVVLAQATWNVYSTGNNWQTAGGFGANDCEQTNIGSLSLTSGETLGTWKEIQLTASAIQEMINGTWSTPYLLMKMDTESDDRYDFYSPIDATPGNRPYIVVTYSVDGESTSVSNEVGVAI